MTRILLDHNVPIGLRKVLVGHDVTLAREIGLAQVGNGALIDAAERAGFEVLITADQNLSYQQNLGLRRIAILVLGTNHWRTIKGHADAVMRAVERLNAGGFEEVDFR